MNNIFWGDVSKSSLVFERLGMNVTAFGKIVSSFVIFRCWNEQFQRPAGIAFYLRPFSLTLLSLIAIRFQTYHSVWVPQSSLYLWGWVDCATYLPVLPVPGSGKRGKALWLLELLVLVLFTSSTFNISSLVAQAVHAELPALSWYSNRLTDFTSRAVSQHFALTI